MFSPAQLLSFRTIAETMHFTEAARSLGLTQSSVSQHVRRLEEAAGRTLLLRDTHRVALTADGEAFLRFAREILDGYARLNGWMSRTERRGRLRLGACEELAQPLASLLEEFRGAHPAIDLDLTVQLSEALTDRLDRGLLDVVVAKRPDGDGRGRTLFARSPIWIASGGLALDAGGAVPLAVFDDPRSITRNEAIEALERAGRAWHLAYTSSNLTGLLAGVRAGFGIALQWPEMRGAAIVELAAEAGLPAARPIRSAVYGRSEVLHGPAAALAELVVAGLRDWGATIDTVASSDRAC